MEALAWVREGEVDRVREWLKTIDIKDKAADEDQAAAIARQGVFGEGNYTGGMSYLMWAVDNSNLEMCKLLVGSYPSLLSHRDMEGATALHYAGLNGTLKIAQYLLGEGVVIDADNNGETPLHCACLNGFTEVASLLVENGADVNAVSLTGQTPLHLAVLNSHLKVISLLLTNPVTQRDVKDKEGVTAEDLAAKSSDVQINDIFVAEKRVKMVEIMALKESLTRVLAENKELKEKDTQNQLAIAEAYKKLKEEEDAHRETSRALSKAMEKVRDRTVDEQTERYEKLVRKHNILELQLKEVEEKESARQADVELERNRRKNNVADIHRSLSNLISLMDTTTRAIVSSKNDLEAVKPLILTAANLPDSHERVALPSSTILPGVGRGKRVVPVPAPSPSTTVSPATTKSIDPLPPAPEAVADAIEDENDSIKSSDTDDVMIEEDLSEAHHPSLPPLTVTAPTPEEIAKNPSWLIQ